MTNDFKCIKSITQLSDTPIHYFRLKKYKIDYSYSTVSLERIFNNILNDNSFKNEFKKGWEYQIHPANTATKTKRHIHIYKNGKEYIQNEDGSPHDKGKGTKGKIPKWLNDELIDKAGWDYNGKRDSFFEETMVDIYPEGTRYIFSDETSVFRPHTPFLLERYTVDSYEGIYSQPDTMSIGLSGLTQSFYVPIIGRVTLPSFSFGLGWGALPVPLLF